MDGIIPTPAFPPDPWLTVAQVAQRVQLHEATIRRAVRQGHLRAVRVGGGRALRFRASWVDAWMETFEVAPLTRRQRGAA